MFLLLVGPRTGQYNCGRPTGAKLGEAAMDLTSIGSFFVFVLVLSVLVFVHEFGHFITAKRLGIHIEEFGFGFPPRLIGIVRDAQGKWRLVKGGNTPKPEELGGPRTIY